METRRMTDQFTERNSQACRRREITMTPTTPSVAYISGPMRGIPYYNFPAFDKTARLFEKLGFEVFNPAEFDRQDGFDAMKLPDDTDWSDPEAIAGFDLRRAMKRDCEAVCNSTHIVMLPGWEKSAGATTELKLAQTLGLTVVDSFCYPLGDSKSPMTPKTAERPTVATLEAAMRAACAKSSNVTPGTSTPSNAVDPSNPKDAIASRKPDLGLIPASADIMESMVLGLGARKYGRFNWRDTNVRAMVYVAALRRHLAQWADGEDTDAESGISHLAHCRANCSILLDALSSGTLIDDRSKGTASKVLDQFVKVPSNG